MAQIKKQVSFGRESSYDLVVCGAGPAGIAAAIQAARLGMKTALVEQYGSPGGAMTVGGDPAIALFYGHKRQVIAGIGWELCLRLADKGWAIIPDFKADLRHSKLGVLVNPVMAAHMIDEMLLEAGVDILYHHKLAYAFTDDGQITAIAVAVKSGLELLRARTYIDCTGDGDLAAFAGAPFALGETGTGELMPGTLRLYYDRHSPDKELDRVLGQARNQAAAQGQDTVYHTFFNSADSRSHSQAEISARRAAAASLAYIKEQGYGDKVSLIGSAPSVWPRESRRIIGLGTVSTEDYLHGRIFPDAICYSFYPLDQHYQDGIRMTFLADGVVPTLPYAALVPQKVKNLLVAGRCISGSRLAQSAFRVKSSCLAMGQAAGAAAALAFNEDQALKDLDITLLQDLLRENGVILPAKEELLQAKNS